MLLRSLLVVGAILGSLPGATQEGGAATVRPFWGSLRPGPHAVGFRSTWGLDPSRIYDTELPDGSRHAPVGGEAPRPLLMNVWYPARANAGAATMRHGEYLEIDPDDPSLAPLADALVAYAKDVILGELSYDFDEVPEAERARWLEELLATPTASIRDAEPAPGRFPLVLYHSGYGSSFEDNAVLCEYLASHGFVVVGGAFLDGDGATLGVDGDEASFRDLEWLVRRASELDFVDAGRLAMAGHSGGAQAAIEFASLPSSALDAVVALDTTQDHYPVTDPRWTGFVEPALERKENIRAPLLFATNPHAVFALGDRLDTVDRYYYTWNEFEHNDFILQGIQYAESAARRDGASTDVEQRARLLRRGYDELCDYIRAFLSATLRGDEAAASVLATRYRDGRPGGAEPHVEVVPKGVSAPDPYELDSPLPPTPRQVRPLILAHGASAAARVLDGFRDSHPAAPIFAAQFTYSILYELVEAGREQDARDLWTVLARVHPGAPAAMVRIGEFLIGYRPERYRGFLVQSLEVALLLEPGRAEWEERLAQLLETSTDGP